MISALDNSFDPAALGLAVPQEAKSEELGQQEFLQLMLTQLKKLLGVTLINKWLSKRPNLPCI